VTHIPTAIDVFGRIYKLVRTIQGSQTKSRNEDVARLQSDIDALKEAIELQTELMEKREKEIAELRRDLQALRGQVNTPWWKRKK